MKTKAALSLAILSALAAGSSYAAVTAEEAARLGTTLTAWGAEKQGNADGTIPAYTGGMTKPPANYVAGSGVWVDPFADEKPLFTIDAKNVAQYADKLTPGVQEMIKRYPDSYQVNVYPTHRTYPQMSAERAAATIKNATNPECKTFASGVGLATDCYGGYPFPIPKDGYEVMWNHLVREKTTVGFEIRATNLVVDAAGNLASPQQYTAYLDYPYWTGGNDGYYFHSLTNTLAPARDSGNKILIWYPDRADEKDQRSWSYSTGQRRVRLAPEFSYDTPITPLGGVLYFDEANLFAGRMDRFDYKLIGKKEMYVPYNTYKQITASNETLLGKKHVNPEVSRWELHRVWVVEATLKEGMRHAASKRFYYIDEDSWQAVASEGFDQSGKVFRVLLANTGANYIAGQGNMDWTSSLVGYDLARGGYTVVSSQGGDPKAYVKPIDKMPANIFTPDAMAGRGVR
ncbi:conserved exported hypothetical protein [Pseudomonas sp. 9AZ]|uniref:DUF1329 domain-containing protein n=1 Tax=Pseudomonas sp. 9AZ TaxID=2653168 RepID=UPI0012F33205|nr:DUF1329 domain-containing protein [Pseudomonas sp. 9AZ]VXD05215.1 conserved exported hypothetical protein [Pseudomonas sp. 9AZ]